MPCCLFLTRSRAAEYFGKSAMTSLGYCQAGRKMLVFAVLRDSSGITADAGDVMVVHRSNHQLVRTRAACACQAPHALH